MHRTWFEFVRIDIGLHAGPNHPMNNSHTPRKAIVTLAIGDRYLQHWKTNCEANWRAYGAQHGFDVICFDKPLDDSARARKRSPAWQKCLILGQDALQRYDRVVWVDSDVLINHQVAPAIDDGVPLEKVGATEEFTFADNVGYQPRQLLERLYVYWNKSIVNPTGQEYYKNYGLPSEFAKVVQTGVLVLSPRHHRSLLETVYYNHEEKGGPEWNYEMRPLSYELLKADVVHWIDPRFNLVCDLLVVSPLSVFGGPRVGQLFGWSRQTQVGRGDGYALACHGSTCLHDNRVPQQLFLPRQWRQHGAIEVREPERRVDCRLQL